MYFQCDIKGCGYKGSIKVYDDSRGNGMIQYLNCPFCTEMLGVFPIDMLTKTPWDFKEVIKLDAKEEDWLKEE